MRKRLYYLGVTLLLVALFAGCSKETRPINYGKDDCSFCKMLVMDNRYGSEIITAKGKILTFDSVECLANYIAEKKEPRTAYHSYWVSSYAEPGKLIDAEKATYLKNDALKSPMGLNVLAVESDAQLSPITQEFGGTRITFEKIFELIKQ